MTLTKLGKYIAPLDSRNAENLYSDDAVVGLSTQKMMINTKADLEGVKLTSYKLMPPNSFAYVPDTSRRGDKMSLAFNSTDNTYLVSSISIVFIVNKPDELISDYLFMYFNRPEFDRYSRFNSWGSARETFSWDDMCDIDIDLPPLPIQQKYVDVYNAMLANQKAYETGLEDLKLVCDATIEQLRNKAPMQEIGSYIEQVDERNVGGKIKLAQGVNVDKLFIPAKRVAENIEATRIVKAGQFAYNKVMKSNGTKLPIALRKGKTCFVSGSYQVFQINKDDTLLPEYLMLWLSRDETQRYAGFISWGSTRDVLSFDTLCEIQLPVPDISVQHAIVDIYNAYIMRREINEKLKAQIKDLCPILIKGSLEEASAWEEKTR
ncbi:MAG: restriction endonuclease subunit S [Clostridiaceae bacterium]|nr:restriction endonuclease subunit S [Clostridiaceae bacterium]